MAVAKNKSAAPPRDTKGAILDSAERLMAEHGIDGVSLRQILSAAGANTAALHYHFGSKEKLIEAILRRQGVDINLRRRALLDAIDASGRTPTVRDVVDALLDPMTELLDRHGEAGRRFLRFLARLQSDRTGVIQRLEKEYFPDVLGRVGRMLRTACPHLPERERGRRITMMLDAMLQSLSNSEGMIEEWTDPSATVEVKDYVESLKDFLMGGLSAPVTHACGAGFQPAPAAPEMRSTK